MKLCARLPHSRYIRSTSIPLNLAPCSKRACRCNPAGRHCSACRHWRRLYFCRQNRYVASGRHQTGRKICGEQGTGASSRPCAIHYVCAGRKSKNCAIGTGRKWWAWGRCRCPHRRLVMDYYLLGKLPEEEAAKPVDQIDEER